jgi:hypothetical protein
MINLLIIILILSCQLIISIFLIILVDAPASSLMDSITNPKVKTAEGKGVGAHSLARSTLGVEGCAGAPRWD